MSWALVQHVKVAKFGSKAKRTEHNDSEEVLGWLTRSTIDKRVPRVLYVQPDVKQNFEARHPGVLIPMQSVRDIGFVSGTASLSIDHKVSTVHPVARPSFLYRVVHAGLPNNGIKSRLGRGTDPISFQLQLQKHLRWHCREPSPFLSATPRWDKAKHIARVYKERGNHGIKVIKFATDGPHWNHEVQRLWNPKDLLRQLGLDCDVLYYMDFEFLVEHSIPEASIKGCLKLWTAPNGRDFFLRDPTGLTQTQTDIDLEEKRRAEHEAKKRKAREERGAKKRELKQQQKEEELKRKREADDEDKLQNLDDQEDRVDTASKSQQKAARRSSKRQEARRAAKTGGLGLRICG